MSKFFWNDKKSRFSLIIEQRFKNTISKPTVTEEISKKLNGVIESQRGEINRALQGDEQFRHQQFLHEKLLEQNRDLREAHEKNLNEMKELKRFQGSALDTISRRKLTEDRDIILELTGKIQELLNEINCMSDSRDFKDAESVRSGQSHVTSQPAFSHFQNVGGMLCRSLGMSSRNDGLPSIWGTHGFSGTFLQIQRRLQHLIRKSQIQRSLVCQNTLHRMWWVKAKHQLRIRDASQDR